MKVKTRTYKTYTISTFRKRFQCQPGLCTAAALSTLYHSLPWTWMVSLGAPSGSELLDRLDYFSDTALTALDSLCTGKVTDPVYLLTVSSPAPLGSEDGLHAHLLVGNLNRTELAALLTSWDGFIPRAAVSRVTRAWGALHYVLSQDRRTGDAEIDRYPSLRHLCDSGRGLSLLIPPILSDSLDTVRASFLRILRAGFSPSRLTVQRRRQPSRSRQARRAERARAKAKRKKGAPL